MIEKPLTESPRVDPVALYEAWSAAMKVSNQGIVLSQAVEKWFDVHGREEDELTDAMLRFQWGLQRVMGKFGLSVIMAEPAEQSLAQVA